MRVYRHSQMEVKSMAKYESLVEHQAREGFIKKMEVTAFNRMVRLLQQKQELRKFVSRLKACTLAVKEKDN